MCCSAKTAVKEKSVTPQQASVKAPVAQPPQPIPLAKEPPKTEAVQKSKEVVPGADALQMADIQFEFDKYSLKPDARNTLNKLASWMKTHQKYNVRIEGNCDERGTVEYNLALGERRAKSAMVYLERMGADKNRISTISYGKEKPLDPGHNEEALDEKQERPFCGFGSKLIDAGRYLLIRE